MSGRESRRGSAQQIAVLIEDRSWRAVPILTAQLKKAAALAIEKGKLPRARKGNATILLTSDDRICELNARYRGKNKPTNVLSFRARASDYLGDVALAYGVASREAESDGKSLSDHAVHLTIHGVLHLLGYDHEKAREAKVMESLEIKLLGELGIPNPYARPKRAA